MWRGAQETHARPLCRFKKKSSYLDRSQILTTVLSYGYLNIHSLLDCAQAERVLNELTMN
jgi:hypothetical protein